MRAEQIVGARTMSLAIAGAMVLATGAWAQGAASARAPVTPRAGHYAGAAGPFTISFKVSANRREITALTSTYNPAADCGIPTNLQTEHFATLAIRRGRFTGSTSLGQGIRTFFSIQGSFSSATTASGTIHGHLTVTSLPPCSDHVSFAVKRVR